VSIESEPLGIFMCMSFVNVYTLSVTLYLFYARCIIYIYNDIIFVLFRANPRSECRVF